MLKGIIFILLAGRRPSGSGNLLSGDDSQDGRSRVYPLLWPGLPGAYAADKDVRAVCVLNAGQPGHTRHPNIPLTLGSHKGV
jgi:hypothetical protein